MNSYTRSVPSSSRRNQSSSHNTKTISYKRIKKKLAVMTMLLSLTTVSADTTVVETMQRCDAATQQNIFSSLPQCLPRKSLVDLRKYFSDDYDVIQVVPDHVMVERCGGSCYHESYNCIPEHVSMRSVEVMLVRSRWPHGESDVQCSQLQVPVHDSCTCGCKLKREDCNRFQDYHERSCRCYCNNTEARSACIASEKTWDPDSCQCHCPLHTITPCPTGYMFDFTSSCSCVLIAVEASEGLIAGITVILIISVAILISLFIMHRQKTGLFKESPYSSADSRRSTNESLGKRTMLMSQESKYEYEKALNKDASVTVFQFDLAKDSSLPQKSV